jgi:hypothetical protein
VVKLVTKTIEYYEWDDIQEFLCQHLGIEHDQFRGYHNVVGGDYKDLWHVWLWHIDEKLFNDSYMPYFASEHTNDADRDYFLKEITGHFGEWVLDFIPALDALDAELVKDTKYGEKEILIHYSW